ncbi:hypothetical protein PUN4_760058 [Paraburkholderia unamae]|nr:hypothetical protein PUN4_760058 [Paraburkholderia unamae]
MALLLDKAVVGPETLLVGVGRVDEFDVMADHLNDAERLVIRCGKALESREVLLHLLVLASLLVLRDRVELVLREAAIGAGLELHGLLRLDARILSLRGNGASQACRHEDHTGQHFHFCLLRVLTQVSYVFNSHVSPAFLNIENGAKTASPTCVRSQQQGIHVA